MTAWTDLTPVAYSVDYVDAAGIPTRTLRAGDGPDVVFLHGTSGHLEAFTRNIVAHVEAGFRCHAIDMLGHGYTGGLDHPYEIPDYVAHLLAYLDAAGIERANLAGESLGGWVAAWLASEHAERVITLQLIAAGGTKANPEVMERIRTSTKQAVSTDDRELTRKRLELLMHDPGIVSDELVDVRHRIYHRPEFVANIDNLLCLQDMQTRQRNLLTPDRLATLADIPTLIIWGHQNPFGDVPEAQLMHEHIPNSRLELYPECGHWPQFERVDLYDPMAIEFLRRAQPVKLAASERAAADRLWEAAATGVPCAPVRDLLGADAEAAYRVQQHNVERVIDERGWRVCGRKIGLTSPAVQAQLGVDRPDFGALFAECGYGDNEEVPFAGLLQPRIEAEVGLVLGDDLDAGTHTVADVISATAYALAVLEIVDSRVAGWDISFADTVADNASGSRFVLGTVPVSLDRDLAAVTMTLSLNGEVRSTGSGAACLGNPLFAARWLADTMSRLGTPLRAGDVVLTGALGKMVDVVAGDVVDATIDGIGRVGVRFAGGTAT